MKNILLIGMNFYEYENFIINNLANQGNKIFYYTDINDFIIGRFFGNVIKIKKKHIIYHNNKTLKQIKDKHIDYVIVLVGRFLQPEFLNMLRALCPVAHFILYLWDDIKRVENFSEIYHFYDKIYSFDPVDSSHYGFTFLPLFFDKIHLQSLNTCRNDIYSAMWMHSDREAIVHAIINKYSSLKMNIFFTTNLCKKIKFFCSDFTKKEIHYRWRKLKIQEVTNGMLQSRAILDVQFPSQVGLTIRTMDALSVGRKLITTNQSVKYYDFYDPQNICIIDRENPVLPSDFFKTPYKPVPMKVLNKYSLSNWLDILFGLKEEKFLITGNPYGL